MDLFNISFIIFLLMFLFSSLSFGAIFVFIIVYAVKQKEKNDNAPRVTLEARVVDKRTVSHRHHNHHNHFSHRHFYHYVAFELEDGQRTELCVSQGEFVSLAVADEGMLTLQGTRFISFDKKGGVAH
jgi:predicted membrane protein